MRFVFAVLFVVCLTTVVLASPAKNKEATPCFRQCGDDYDPVCGKAKYGSKERLITFGSECVVTNYNCEHRDDPYLVKSDGECGGNVSVRLS